MRLSDFDAVCREAFTPVCESILFRSVAVATGGLADSAVNYLVLDTEKARYEYERYPACNEMLESACEWRDMSQRWVVKGTLDTPFPPDGPPHKYAALFDQRPCFDAIRRAFLIRSSLHERERTMQVLLDAVGKLAEEQPHGALAKSLGATLVSKLITLTQGEPNWSDPPEGFFEAAWPAYIEAVQEGDYFYSSEEVLAVAHGAEQNVVVTKTEHEAYLVVGQTNGFDGPQAIVALQRGGGGRVRTHFERLLPEATLQKLERRAG